MSHNGISKAILSGPLHSQFCGHWLQEFINLIDPESILGVELAYSRVFPIGWKPTGCFPVNDPYNCTINNEDIETAQVPVGKL